MLKPKLAVSSWGPTAFSLLATRSYRRSTTCCSPPPPCPTVPVPRAWWPPGWAPRSARSRQRWPKPERRGQQKDHFFWKAMGPWGKQWKTMENHPILVILIVDINCCIVIVIVCIVVCLLFGISTSHSSGWFEKDDVNSRRCFWRLVVTTPGWRANTLATEVGRIRQFAGEDDRCDLPLSVDDQLQAAWLATALATEKKNKLWLKNHQAAFCPEPTRQWWQVHAIATCDVPLPSSVCRHFFDPVHGSVLKGCIYYFKIAVPWREQSTRSVDNLR